MIDGNSLMNRAFYAMSVFTTKDGLPTNGIFGFVKLLLKIIDDEHPEYLCVAFDVHAPTFRHKMYDEYKGTRKPMPDELRVQFPVLKELLREMNICTVELPGYEADDIIGTFSRKYEGIESVIFTGDRDSFQLVNDKVTVCFTKRGVSDVDRLTGENFFEKVGLTPAQIIEEKALMGDSSDNIPGVKGIGEKTTKQLLAEFHSVDELYRRLDEVKDTVAMRLILGEPMARLSHTLATINVNVPLNLSLEDCKLSLPFTEEVRTHFAKLEFRSLVENKHFSTERKAEVTVKVCQNFDEFYKQFASCEQFAFDFSKDCHIYLNEVEYVFPIKQGLLDGGFFLPELKPMFSRIFTGNQKAIVVDVKQLAHTLDEMEVTLSCPVEDVTLMRYTCDSNARPSDGVELAKGYALPAENCAYALFKAYEEAFSTASEAEMRLYREMELPLSFVLLDMERTGVRVDASMFEALGEQFGSELATLSTEIYRLAGGTFNINSPFQLSEVLFERLGYSPKGFKKNQRGGYSTNADVLEKLAEEYEIARYILRYREIQKLQSTYIDGMKPLVKNGLIHTTYNQTMTSTGRLSSANPNLQNIPVRRESGKQLRKLFIAREGNVFVDADYSQIELRLMAHYSRSPSLISAYKEGKDIHAITASEVFGVPLDEVTSEHRRRAKAVNFGIIYGISPFGLARDLGISNAEAAEYIDKYFKTYSAVKEFMDETVANARRDGYVTTAFLGRKRYIPELKSSNYVTRSFGERAAMNMPLQGTAADIIKIAMVNVAKRLKDEGLQAKMIMQVHDELVVDTPVPELEQVKAIVRQEMESAVSLNVPLVADISVGESWYDAKQ